MSSHLLETVIAARARVGSRVACILRKATKLLSTFEHCC